MQKVWTSVILTSFFMKWSTAGVGTTSLKKRELKCLAPVTLQISPWAWYFWVNAQKLKYYISHLLQKHVKRTQ